MALLAGGLSTASIHDSVINNYNTAAANGRDANGGDAHGSSLGEGGTKGVVDGEDADGAGGSRGGAAGVDATSAAAAAVAAASASRSGGGAGDTRSAADGGGEVWVEPPVVVKKYNKVCWLVCVGFWLLLGRWYRQLVGFL